MANSQSNTAPRKRPRRETATKPAPQPDAVAARKSAFQAAQQPADESAMRPTNPVLATMIVSPNDLGGDYFVWLDADCPVHSAAVAGIDIPKHIDIHDHVCPACNHRFAPAVGGAPNCPKCAENGESTAGVMQRQSIPRRAKKRVKLRDGKVRELLDRLDPLRKTIRDERGRILDGPRQISGKNGDELLWKYVRILPVEADRSEPESAEMALLRTKHLRRLAVIAERLASNDRLSARDRIRLRGEIAQISRTLGIAVDGDDEPIGEPNDESGDTIEPGRQDAVSAGAVTDAAVGASGFSVEEMGRDA